MRIAHFGQGPFGRDVLQGLREAGHEVAAVYAPPPGARPDPLAEAAAAHGLPLFRYRAMRSAGKPLPERVQEHAALGVDLNVLAFVTMILPEAVVNAPRLGSLCFHPSLLPKYRGGAALAWQIIEGAPETGVTVFRPDAGVDSGPIVLQKGGVRIEPHHSAASLYFEKLYELGVETMLEAVALTARGEAEARVQNEADASYHGLLDERTAALDWSRPAAELDRLVRGCDPNPGAHTALEDGRRVRFFGGSLLKGGAAAAEGAAPGVVVATSPEGLQVAAKGGALLVSRLRLAGGAKQPAAEAGLPTGTRFV